MLMRALLGTALALAACGGGKDDGNQGAAAPAGAPAAGDPASPDRAGKPLAADPAAGSPVRLAAVDDRRWVIDDAVLAQLAIDAAAGQLRARFTGDGVKIEEAPDGSTLAHLGLKAGDLIATIAGEKVADAGRLRAAWTTVRRDGTIVAEVRRDGQTVERRYFLYDALDQDYRRHLERLELRTGDNKAAPRVGAALRTGVRPVGPDSYEVDEKVLALATGPRGSAPVGDLDSAPRGVRLFDTDSVAGALGISPYDVVKAVDDRDVSSELGLIEQLTRLSEDKARAFTLSVVRVREPIVLRYKVVTDLVMDAELDAALAEWRAEEARRAPPTIDPLATSSGLAGSATGFAGDLSSDDLATLLDQGVKRIDDTSYEVDRKLIDKVLANPLAASRGARVVPSIKDGKANGFKIYAVRPNSVYAKLGLSNGDTITAVNGYDLSSPDRALEIYTKIRDAHVIRVEIIRRGKPVMNTYRIR